LSSIVSELLNNFQKVKYGTFPRYSAGLTPGGGRLDVTGGSDDDMSRQLGGIVRCDSGLRCQSVAYAGVNADSRPGNLVCDQAAGPADGGISRLMASSAHQSARDAIFHRQVAQLSLTFNEMLS
jgi:hypothetical protein